MTKFLFYTDIHFAGESPKHRKDDFTKTLIDKQREIYGIAKDEHCDFVAFGGDYFNYHRVYNYSVLGNSMDILESSGLNTYMVIGEHDLYGHNMSSFPNSTLAFFAKCCKSVKILTEPVVLGEVKLYPKHEPDKVDVMATFKKDLNYCNVCICHELLTPNRNGVFECFNTTDIGDTGFDLVLSGDLHSGFKTHKVFNTTFCNPGSIARRTVADADRMPQVAIVTVEGKNCSIELRELKCAKPGKEVFEEDNGMFSGTETENSDFTKDLIELEKHSSDIYELIKQVAKEKDIKDEIVNYLFSKREIIGKTH